MNYSFLSIVLATCLGITTVPAPITPHDSLSVLLFNYDRPFISASLAEKIALAIVTEKYGDETFSPVIPAIVTDDGEAWIVMVQNGLVEKRDARPIIVEDGRPYARQISIVIKKKNGEVLSVR